MKILVINAGSSSLKYQLFEMPEGKVLAKGLCERIGIDGKLKHKNGDNAEYVIDAKMDNHAMAIEIVINTLLSKEQGCIADISEIKAVGHRVVHGGEEFSKSELITDAVLKAIDECSQLAPLHNPPNLTGINACWEVMGKEVSQVAVFDTAFHQTMPQKAYVYPIPYEYYEKYKIRKYGFHGTSHKYVSLKVAELMGKKPEEVKIVTCHLGNGSSITAIDCGKSVDTTMGFTPLDGLIMGTRSGSIDPAVVSFLMEKEGMTGTQVTDILNKKSGALGVSGISSDLRDVEKAMNEGDKQAELAINMLCYQVKKYIGSYAAAMGGIDAIVFTAGVGENNGVFRKAMVDGLQFMGVSIDDEKNKLRGQAVDISAADAKVKTFVIPTDEEMMIAIDTLRIVSK